MKTEEFSQEVMTDAQRLFELGEGEFTACLEKARMVHDLLEAMQGGAVRFFYRRVDGKIRQALGTLESGVLAGKIKGTDSRRKNEDIVTYWDLGKGDFRSFKKSNLLEIGERLSINN